MMVSSIILPKETYLPSDAGWRLWTHSQPARRGAPVTLERELKVNGTGRRCWQEEKKVGLSPALEAGSQDGTEKMVNLLEGS